MEDNPESVELKSAPEWKQALLDAQNAAMSAQENVANFITVTSPVFGAALKGATAPNLAQSGNEQSPGIPSQNTEKGEGKVISGDISLTANSPELISARAAAGQAALREHFQKIQALKNQDAAELKSLKDQDAAKFSSSTYEPQ